MTKNAALVLPLDLPAQAGLTPVMQQYRSLKDAHPGCLLFFRMGDFYELFYEDAVVAAPILDVALTSRNKDAVDEVPMAGVPVHAYEAYIPKLIKAGFRVAIAEQMEDPASAKKRGGSKAVVAREVVRILTPGTLTEDSFLEARSASHLAVLAEQAGRYALCWCDISAPAPLLEETDRAGLAGLLARVDAKEILLCDRLLAQPDIAEMLRPYKDALTPLPAARMDSDNANRTACLHYKVASLDAFGAFSGAQATALGVLIDYVALTQKYAARVLAPPALLEAQGLMAIDAATRRNLELTMTMAGARKGSLLDSIDCTRTGAGARLLADMLAAPLRCVDEINRRAARIAFFTEKPDLRCALRERLHACPDLARALTRLMLKRGGPRDLAVVRAGLEASAALGFTLDKMAGGDLSADLLAVRRGLGEHSQLVETLSRALKSELPLQARDGGFIAPNYSQQLDELVGLRDDGKKLIAGLQAKYAGLARIPTLKIRFNNVIGYHVEVSPAQADKLMQPPLNVEFIHRQSLVSGVRFTTAELAELARKVSESAERTLALEMELFDGLAQEVLRRADAIREAAGALALFDVATSLAELAATRGWVRAIVDDSLAFNVRAGRHPVVEASLAQQGAAPFTPNACDLSPGGRLWLLTGPNMAGKSTFLRQNALVAILAQMGSFVPAQAAHIGIVDKLFSRVGAADDLASGRSTFMVEMIETAAILNQAGAHSLVILDEIGRGTATFDGLAIAWGALEHLYHHNQCRGLFATHYHELTALQEQLPGLRCAHARVKEWQGKIVFLHEILAGCAQGSYGIHVAELAGIPAPVIARAKKLLREFEAPRGAPLPPAPVPQERVSSEIEQALAAIDADNLSPREALDALYRLKKISHT